MSNTGLLFIYCSTLDKIYFLAVSTRTHYSVVIIKIQKHYYFPNEMHTVRAVQQISF